jgi:hypothetical protein
MTSARRHGGGGHGHGHHAAAQFRAPLRWSLDSEQVCVRVCLGYRLASTVTTVLDWDSVTQVVSSLSTPADLTLDP